MEQDFVAFDVTTFYACVFPHGEKKKTPGGASVDVNGN